MGSKESSQSWEEGIATSLQGLYESYGYARFRMKKFEEYEFYLQNKDFLIGDRMITFSDGNGTLLAMKPDVTLSIIKNSKEGDKSLRKVYYEENVYRIPRGEDSFQEILQSGLECVGELDLYQNFEVIALACESLSCISADYMLDLSHLGLLSALLEEAGLPEAEYGAALSLLREKNAGELQRFGLARALSEEGLQILGLLVSGYGKMEKALPLFAPYCRSAAAKEALQELQSLGMLLEQLGCSATVQLDFSVVNDLGYYNGLVFQGFVKGLPEAILSGGHYDKLLQKMGRQSQGIGFALRMDALRQLRPTETSYDADLLFLYDESTDFFALHREAEALRECGKRVLVRSKQDADLRVKAVRQFGKGGI